MAMELAQQFSLFVTLYSYVATHSDVRLYNEKETG